MDDKWLNKLREKVNDHDPQYKDDFWESIEERLFPEEDKKLAPVKKFPIARVITFAASIAACLLVMFVSYFLLKDNSSPSGKNQIAGAKKPVDTSSSPQNDGADLLTSDQNDTQVGQTMPELSDLERGKEQRKAVKINFKDQFGSNRKDADQSIAAAVPEVGTTEPVLSDNNVVSDNKVLSANSNTPKADANSSNGIPQILKPNEQDNELIKKEKLLEDLTINKKLMAKAKKPNILKVLGGSLLSAGVIPGASSVASGYASFDNVAAGADSTHVIGPGSDHLSDILAGNQNQQVNSTIRKNKALSFGISVNTDISKKWSLSSGLFYTKLSSEIEAGSDEYNYSIKQVSHYIGVPVQLNYRFINKPKVRVYVGAGGQVDFAVASKRTNSYEVAGASFSDNDPSYKPQNVRFSLAAAPGIEYRFSKNLGLYVEPGIRYFFRENNSNEANTERNPAGFSLRTGLRYTINAKD